MLFFTVFYSEFSDYFSFQNFYYFCVRIILYETVIYIGRCDEDLVTGKCSDQIFSSLFIKLTHYVIQEKYCIYLPL